MICDTPDCQNVQTRAAPPTCGGPCLAGTYCPRGTGPLPIRCPRGTYSATNYNYNSSQCLPCRAGWYCPFDNMTDYTPYLCPSGYFCPAGSSTATTPQQACVYGSHTRARTHTYTQLRTQAAPLQGHRTSVWSRVAYGLACSVSLQRTPNKRMVTEQAYGLERSIHPFHPFSCCSLLFYLSCLSQACPIGFACPAGSSTPLPCNASYYQDTPQQPYCKYCLAGYACPGTSIDGIVGGIRFVCLCVSRSSIDLVLTSYSYYIMHCLVLL